MIIIEFTHHTRVSAILPGALCCQIGDTPSGIVAIQVFQAAVRSKLICILSGLVRWRLKAKVVWWWVRHRGQDLPNEA